jgi:hypothetical protein
MGSGNKRKSNDAVRINLPQKPNRIGGGTGSSGGSGGSPRDINRVCPPAFKAPITLKKPVPDKTDIILKGDEMFIFGQFVGKLSPAHMKIIIDCAGNEIHYAGRVVNQNNNKSYAYFEQTILR